MVLKLLMKGISYSTIARAFCGPKTDTPLPPAPVVPPCAQGDYCMKAYTQVYDEKKKHIGNYVGYSHEFDIANRVTRACDKMVEDTPGNLSCEITRLVFVRDPPRCDNKVVFEWVY